MVNMCSICNLVLSSVSSACANSDSSLLGREFGSLRKKRSQAQEDKGF